MTGFADKLGRQATAHRVAGLVWVGDADLGRFFRRRHPHIRHVRYSGMQRNDAYAHGRAAGRRIVLRKGVDAGPSSNGRLHGAPKE